MTDVDFENISGGFDPFADAEAESESQNYIHVRVQQRNGRKSLTTVQGIEGGFDYKKVLKAFKKEFCCNGTVVEDPELGKVIQLQGDQRKNVHQFLVSEKIVKNKDLIKIHGF
uniref:SUI1 domain-containing protein n=1 Tax=Pyramimonas obovata TaxID=1411642 RepID=A0A7S0RAI2_9CHLO|mmetsp:Transcript_29612/g.64623  ORF Transcript_29612/g.64623 Transcript_29612/m.64623 type:complete len:113 (+) Transcript_29612:165-503(+)